MRSISIRTGIYHYLNWTISTRIWNPLTAIMLLTPMQCRFLMILPISCLIWSCRTEIKSVFLLSHAEFCSFVDIIWNFFLQNNVLDNCFNRISIKELLKCKQAHDFILCLINFVEFYRYETRESESADDDGEYAIRKQMRNGNLEAVIYHICSFYYWVTDRFFARIFITNASA